MARNPIAKSFGAGINRPKVVPSKKTKLDRVKHKSQEFDS